MVINFDMPWNLETYYHRIGRTARFGKFGVSFLLMSKEQAQKFFTAKSFEFNIKKLKEKDENFAFKIINDLIKEKRKNERLSLDDSFKNGGDCGKDGDKGDRGKEEGCGGVKRNKRIPGWDHLVGDVISNKWVDASENTIYDSSVFKYFNPEEEYDEDQEDEDNQDNQEQNNEDNTQIPNQTLEDHQDKKQTEMIPESIKKNSISIQNKSFENFNKILKFQNEEEKNFNNDPEFVIDDKESDSDLKDQAESSKNIEESRLGKRLDFCKNKEEFVVSFEEFEQYFDYIGNKHLRETIDRFESAYCTNSIFSEIADHFYK